jgi:hypothetical protein
MNLKNKLLLILITSILIIFTFYTYSYATPTLVNKLVTAFNLIKNWIMLFATPAAAIAVGTGVFMKKFSFGDEERMRTGKKLIRSSLFSYAFFISIDLVLDLIQGLV